MIGRRRLVPYLRLFPIWRFGPLYDRLDGRRVGVGWSPDWFGTWEVEDDTEPSGGA